MDSNPGFEAIGDSLLNRAGFARIVYKPLGVAPSGIPLMEPARALMPSRKIPKPRCTVCHSNDRHRVELLCLAGTPAATVGEKFGLGRMAIWRHMANHVDAETKASMVADVPLAELAERAAREGGSLLDHFHIVRLTVMDALKRASAVNDYSGTASLAKRATEINREIGRLSGEILNSTPVSHFTQTNVYMGAPIMARLEAMLVERLAPFPDALRAVLLGLADLDGPTSPSLDLVAVEAPRAA